jgi:triphosphoribosyl-dephospho-CoA synthase
VATSRRNDIERAIGRSALVALHRELALSPKPGLVTPICNGSHRDMSAQTFIRSLVALRGYFPAIAAAGYSGGEFRELQALGLAAEKRMMAATGGVNTHRGAIFALGLLAASAASLVSENPRSAFAGDEVAARCASLWGADILATARSAPDSHGIAAGRKHGAGGARAEAAAGFPTVIGVGLPAYREALQETCCETSAAVQTLFALIAHVTDTNLLHRGGPQGLALAQEQARAFLRAGGVLNPNWRENAHDIGAQFIALRLSPGGSADLLAATLFLWQLEQEGVGLGARTSLPRTR